MGSLRPKFSALGVLQFHNHHTRSTINGAKMFVQARDTAANVMYYAMGKSASFLPHSLISLILKNIFFEMIIYY